MLIISNTIEFARALDSPLDVTLKQRLALRRQQLLVDTGDAYDLGDLVQFAVVEPGDTIEVVEPALGFPLFTEPAFEWIELADGWFEAVTILSDDGFGIALFVPDNEEISRPIMSLIRAEAEVMLRLKS